MRQEGRIVCRTEQPPPQAQEPSNYPPTAPGSAATRHALLALPAQRRELKIFNVKYLHSATSVGPRTAETGPTRPMT